MVKDAFVKDRTVPIKSDEEEHYSPNNLKSCSYVVISVYETFMSRPLNVTKKEKSSGLLAGTFADCSPSLRLSAPMPSTMQAHADHFCVEITSRA